MKINTINNGSFNKLNFKAHLSPEVKENFGILISSSDSDTYEGKKIINDISKIASFMSHVSISIERCNVRGKDYYGYVMHNPRTSETRGISIMEESPRNLSKLYHINNLKYALVDEYIRENNPPETEESRKCGMLDSLCKKIFNNSDM